MAIVNRTLDPSQQTGIMSYSQAADLVNGVTMSLGIVSSPAVLQAVTVAAKGLSGAPTVQIGVWRFLTGSGATTLLGGVTSLTLVAEGTSGVQTCVLAATGSTFLNLQANDMIVAVSGGGTGAATKGIAINALIKYTQDIKTSYGV